MTFLAGLLLLGVLIVVHECGHFIVAKLCGVRVLTFSIGFGPKLVAFKRGDTEYRISAIPLGGYVRMYGDQLTEEIPEDQKCYSFLHQSTWKKSLIAFAGPLFNFILPVVLFFIVLIGSQKIPLPVIGSVLPNSPAAKAGLLSGDHVLSVNGQTPKDFSELSQLIAAHPNDTLNLKVKGAHASSPRDVNVQTDAEKSENPLDEGKMLGRIGILPVLEAPVVAVLDELNPAYKAGLRSMDKVLKVNGEAVASYPELMRMLQVPQGKAFELLIEREGKELAPLQLPVTPLGNAFSKMPERRYAVSEEEWRSSALLSKRQMTERVMKQEMAALVGMKGLAFVGNLIQGVAEASPAEGLKLEKGDRIVAVDGVLTPNAILVMEGLAKDPMGIHVLGVQSSKGFFVAATRLKAHDGKEKQLGAKTPAYVLGVQFASAYTEGATKEVFVGPWQAFVQACARTWDLIVMTLASLWMLLSFKVSAAEIGGPIMIFGIAGQAAAQGFDFYAFVMAMISVNLGLLNLLPIPVLDGGHLLLFGIEAVQRRPLSIKTREIAMRIGFFILLLLMALAIFNDVTRLLH